jgi:hypothetical protein
MRKPAVQKADPETLVNAENPANVRNEVPASADQVLVVRASAVRVDQAREVSIWIH